MKKFFTYLLHFNHTKLQEVHDTMDTESKTGTLKKEMKAPEHCVNNVLAFAKALHVEETKNTGKVEMLLN